MPKSPITEKENLHPRNLHRQGYDFNTLMNAAPKLRPFVNPNAYGDVSLDFADPQAVIALNQALLKYFYGVRDWNVPDGYLCPPIPGRADYIHYAADILAGSNDGTIPTGKHIKVLDIGTGSNAVYPLIGNSVYGWQFVATDIDPIAITSVKRIIAANPQLQNAIECRLQLNQTDVFNGIIKPGERYDISVCNPPFHGSLREARAGSSRKWDNLKKPKEATPLLNFGGKSNELWAPGGEAAIINRMVEQSRVFADSCLWFTTLVSKKETLPGVYKTLDYHKAAEVKTINLAQGQKISRIVAWTFADASAQRKWAESW